MSDRRGRLTRLINRWFRGDRSDEDELWEILVVELRKVAASVLRRFRSHHTIQPADLLNELYLELSREQGRQCPSRSHFFALAAKALRRFLIDYERTHSRRPQGRPRTTINTDLTIDRDRDPLGVIAFDDLLCRLAEFDPRGAEVVEMKVFAAMTWEQISEVTGRSMSTVKRDWKDAAAWLRSQYETRGRDGQR